MKALFLPMIVVGAVTLWYSNAQAAEFGQSRGQRVGNHSQGAGPGQARHHMQRDDQRYSQRHARNQRGNDYGQRFGNAGRHDGLRRNESRGNGHAGHDFGRSRRDESNGFNRARHADSHGNGRSGHDFDRSRQDGHGRFGDNRHAEHRQGVNERQHGQRERIHQASHSGQLTNDERKSLWAEQRGIAAEERQYRADGRLDRDERIDLQKDLTMASQHIYNESHDDERRGASSPHGEARRSAGFFPDRR